MKYTVIVASFKRPSCILVHTTFNSGCDIFELEKKVCEKANAYTVCGPYMAVTVYEGWLENKGGLVTFKWELDEGKNNEKRAKEKV